MRLQALRGAITCTEDSKAEIDAKTALLVKELFARNELTQDDGEVTVRCGLDHVGTSSIRTREEIRKRDGTLSAEAAAVIVPRDAKAGRSRPLTDQERKLLGAEAEV